jgi:acetyl esterase/lipase/lysophospholipase L1-like esterase
VVRRLLALTALLAAFSGAASGAQGEVPFSEYASTEARDAWIQRGEFSRAWEQWKSHLDPALKGKSDDALYLIWLRSHIDTVFGPSQLEKQKKRYPVSVTTGRIAGVYTETFTPAEGVLPANAQRVLINLHGGAFLAGSRVLSQVESIPIASVGKIKVISVDYRMAPEFHFPAATEDVVAVYQALLKEYRPENIGVYGCSAGATLTAQVTAALIRAHVPLPGAIGMLCGTGDMWARGDSLLIWSALTGEPVPTQGLASPVYDYFKRADPQDPLVFPMRHPEILRSFPPSLLITGTRSREMSPVIEAHKALSLLGVSSQLFVWDGLQHGFMGDPDLPESREAYDLIARFFAEQLGRARFEDEISAFLQADLREPPQPCGVLFVGSSSIRFWKSLDKDMAPVPVINRGFGGSAIADINNYFDRVVTPYHPAAIFFYAGENDVAAGKPAADVVADFETFLALKSRTLGGVPVYFISLKPSKLRFDQLSRQGEVNAAIRLLARRHSELRFIDVRSAMMENGAVRDVYAEDGLHLNGEGYRIWTTLIRPAVVEAEAHVGNCRAGFRPPSRSK